jgi:hypothetical protein
MSSSLQETQFRTIERYWKKREAPGPEWSRAFEYKPKDEEREILEWDGEKISGVYFGNGSERKKGLVWEARPGKMHHFHIATSTFDRSNQKIKSDYHRKVI